MKTMKTFFGVLFCGGAVIVPIMWGISTWTVLVGTACFCAAIPCFQKAER